MIEIQSTSSSESSHAATCNNNWLVTRDFTPLEPDTEELKYYLPDIGKIVEINLEDGERVKLIEFNIP